MGGRAWHWTGPGLQRTGGQWHGGEEVRDAGPGRGRQHETRCGERAGGLGRRRGSPRSSRSHADVEGSRVVEQRGRWQDGGQARNAVVRTRGMRGRKGTGGRGWLARRPQRQSRSPRSGGKSRPRRSRTSRWCGGRGVSLHAPSVRPVWRPGCSQEATRRAHAAHAVAAARFVAVAVTLAVTVTITVTVTSPSPPDCQVGLHRRRKRRPCSVSSCGRIALAGTVWMLSAA